MVTSLRLVLLGFALVAFAGAGSALAVIRFRRLSEGETDWGMAGVAMLLVTFAGLCTALGAGWIGLLAFGGVALWVSYLFMAQHIGLFRIEADAEVPDILHAEEPHSS
ncbi:MAG: hypothetical protein ACRELD_07850 [Longimicrobiales bacterium]